MKLSELKKILSKTDEEIEVNHMQFFEDHFFHHGEKGKNSKDYRNEAIDFAIENKVSFCNTANNTYDLVKRFVSLKCPKCGKPMKMGGGGGSMEHTTIRFRCKECKVEASITVSNKAIYYGFRGD